MRLLSGNLCTIRVPHDFEAGELNKDFFEFDLALPTKADVGDLALILGFPAGHRYAIGNKIIHARCQYVTMLAPGDLR